MDVQPKTPTVRFFLKRGKPYEKMLISVKILISVLGSAIGGFPSSERSKEVIDLSKWALTQVFIYYTEEFDQLAIPECHGTLLTDKHVLAKGSCVKDQEIILIVKVTSVSKKQLLTHLLLYTVQQCLN